MKTLLYTIRDAADATGLKESTVGKYAKQYLVPGVEYIVHERMVRRPSDGATFRRRQAFVTEAGIVKLNARQFGRLWERSNGRLPGPPAS
jgi:hypothetical protein